MRPPDDDFSRPVLGCFGWIISYLVAAFVLFFVVLFVCSFFYTPYQVVIFTWLGLMFFVTIFFLLKVTEGED